MVIVQGYTEGNRKSDSKTMGSLDTALLAAITVDLALRNTDKSP